jgi:hypothetical protein
LGNTSCRRSSTADRRTLRHYRLLDRHVMGLFSGFIPV